MSVEEGINSRACDKDRAELHFIVRGTADGGAARAELLAWLLDEELSAYDGKLLQGARVEPVHVDSENEEDCIWEGVVEYVPWEKKEKDPTEVGDVIVTASTAAGTEHVTAALERLASDGQGAMGAPEAIGIGDNGQGEIEGVDIFVPALELEVTKVFESAAAAPAPLVLYGLVAKTNGGPWSVTDTKTGREWAFATGTLLYLGHREGRAREDGALEIGYRFQARLPQESFELGLLVVPEKPPWAYLWFRWEQKEDGTRKKLYADAIGAYVDRVYEEGTFTDLGIGTGPPEE